MKRRDSLFEPRPQGDASRVRLPSATSEHPFGSGHCSHQETTRYHCLFCGETICHLCRAMHWMERHEVTSDEI